ncbi:MAG: sodium:calcium antiporter [Christensenellaceae bacterium]|jgi:cation:H+ antiporter|nr:sodium:calcium antiporter [Christensenellaceae bacterium]
MTLFLFALLFFLGFFFIIKGSNLLVDTAIRLKNITRLNDVFIGATFVSVATCLPELFISAFGAIGGDHGLAVGNSFGSLIFNMALVFGIYFLAEAKKNSGAGYKTKLLFFVVVFAVVALFSSNFNISWLEGLVLMFGFGVYLAFSIKQANKTADFAETIKEKKNKGEIHKIILFFLIGQIFLVLGAWAIVYFGERISHLLAISESFLGLSLISLGTGLPELITAIACLRKKQGGIGVGNILGSSIINMTLLLGLCGAIGGLTGLGFAISREVLFFDMPLILLVCAVIATSFSKKLGRRWQGFALLGLYIIYIAWIFLQEFLYSI